MTDMPNEKQGSNLQETERSETVNGLANSARIKRMRGWLGVKSSSTLHGYDDGGGGVVYGDGHSGWNR